MTLKKIAYYTIAFFFWISLIQQLMVLGGLPDIPLFTVYILVNSILGIYCMFNLPNYTRTDFVVIIYMVYLLANFFVIDYPDKWEYFYRGITWQWAYILFYFIGRASGLSLKEALSQTKWPVLFACICGLFFFFTEPAWYMNMKYDQITSEYATERNILEVFRLSSFWGHPYVLTYATFLYSLVLMNSLFNGDNSVCTLGIEEEADYTSEDDEEKYYEEYTSETPTKKNYIIAQLVLIGIVLVLAQIRAVLFMYFICLIYFFLKNSSATITRKVLISSATAVILSAGLYFGQKYLPDANLDYIVEHVTDLFDNEKTEERLEYTSGDVKLLDPIIGNGFARYNFVARAHNKFAMVDSEYQKHLYETGYVGLGILILILLCFARQLARKRDCNMERGYLLFIVIACIGASVLSNPSQYGYIFWFAMGTLYFPKEESYLPDEYELIES